MFCEVYDTDSLLNHYELGDIHINHYELGHEIRAV